MPCISASGASSQAILNCLGNAKDRFCEPHSQDTHTFTQKVQISVHRDLRLRT